MCLWSRMAAVMAFALVIACGGDQGASPQAIPPAVVDGPTIATRPASPLPSPPQSEGGALAVTARPHTPVPSPATQLPIPTPTAMAPPEPTATRATPAETPMPTQDSANTPVSATSQPDPAETPSNPTPSPTVDAVQQVARGKRLVERNNCLGCHSIDGQTYSAPTFKGLFGSVRELRGGDTVTAEDEYLWESIKRPNTHIIQGYFPDAMPTVFFNEAEIDAMVAYIKTLE